MTNRRPQVLWITPQPPDLISGGGSIRQAHFLTALTRHADVDLLVGGSQPLTDDTLRDACRSVTEHIVPPDFGGGPIGSRIGHLRSALGPEGPREVFVDRKAAQRLAADLAERDAAQTYDAVVVQHAAFCRLLPARRRGRWICELDRLASIDMRQLREITTTPHTRWLHAREEQAARRLERWIVASYDAVIGVSEEDLAELPGHQIVIPNGVDTTAFAPSPLPGAPRVVMTGYLGTLPNITGAVWLCREILPAIRREVPDVCVDLVGGAPSAEVRALGDLPGVTVHADVPEIAPYLRAARVAVVPLVMGSGTRLKALEAFAAGRPVVGTSIGLIGLGVVNGVSAIVADEPADFASGVVALLRDAQRSETLVANAAQIAAAHDWNALADRYVDAVLGG
ncbi:MAG TPA: glycosyltransferase family 4 protein [Mycobacteriales bacterium]|nr:glycosyltransferase family 4 protein [Mycobacteriales bacterium]